MSAPFRFPRFFVTSPAPCPYLAGKTERKVFTELSGNNANELNDALGRIGFRRSQSVAYRPSCADCTACVSVRVCAGEFKPSGSQKRTIRRNADLIVTACKPWATEEQYALLRSYLGARHPDGGMADMDEQDFADMVEQTPVDSYMIEYREPTTDGSRGRLSLRSPDGRPARRSEPVPQEPSSAHRNAHPSTTQPEDRGPIQPILLDRHTRPPSARLWPA